MYIVITSTSVLQNNLEANLGMEDGGRNYRVIRSGTPCSCSENLTCCLSSKATLLICHTLDITIPPGPKTILHHK